MLYFIILFIFACLIYVYLYNYYYEKLFKPNADFFIEIFLNIKSIIETNYKNNHLDKIK